MRCEPGEDKRHTVTFLDCEFGNCRQILAPRFDWRAQNKSVRTCERFQSAVPGSHPRDSAAVIEPNDELHLHHYLTANSFHDADEVGIFAARRHEID